jgi:hypothetical protein
MHSKFTYLEFLLGVLGGWHGEGRTQVGRCFYIYNGVELEVLDNGADGLLSFMDGEAFSLLGGAFRIGSLLNQCYYIGNMGELFESILLY